MARLQAQAAGRSIAGGGDRDACLIPHIRIRLPSRRPRRRAAGCPSWVTRNTWVVNRPEEIERILTHGKEFIKDKELRKTRPLMGDGLVTSEGDLWKKQRRMVRPSR